MVFAQNCETAFKFGVRHQMTDEAGAFFVEFCGGKFDDCEL